MPTLELPAPRFDVKDAGASLHITLPSQKPWFQIVFVSLWLVGWLFGVLTAGGALLMEIRAFSAGNAASGADSPLIFLMVWLTGWTIGGCYALFTLLWHLGGREVFTLSRNELTIERYIFSGRLSQKTFAVANIKEMHVSPYVNRSWAGRGLSLQHLFVGPLVFDYGAKTFRYANGASEAEAKQMITLMKPYLRP